MMIFFKLVCNIQINLKLIHLNYYIISVKLLERRWRK